jgi:hypothetical protein
VVGFRIVVDVDEVNHRVQQILVDGLGGHAIFELDAGTQFDHGLGNIGDAFTGAADLGLDFGDVERLSAPVSFHDKNRLHSELFLSSILRFLGVLFSHAEVSFSVVLERRKNIMTSSWIFLNHTHTIVEHYFAVDN